LLIEGSDYTVRLIPFPVYNVGGMVTPNPDGSFSVYINSNLSQERQKQALEHELDHIRNNDFYNGKPIQEVEAI
jgi:Zn-dependent peptidase ImmA (M78 family)